MRTPSPVLDDGIVLMIPQVKSLVVKRAVGRWPGSTFQDDLLLTNGSETPYYFFIVKFCYTFYLLLQCIALSQLERDNTFPFHSTDVQLVLKGILRLNIEEKASWVVIIPHDQGVILRELAV